MSTPIQHQPDPAAPLFDAHLDVLLDRYQRAMDACGHTALVIDAGEPGHWFLDDISSDWRTNPHFRLFTPLAPADGCSLLLRPDRPPVLLHLRPRDYWHMPPAAPTGDWTGRFDIRPVADADAREAAIRAWLDEQGNAAAGAARIGPQAGALGTVHNPAPLLAHVDFERARKTPYELECMRAASRRAVRGHRAAATRFLDGGSEYEIQLAYLAATGHEDCELPYRNIVALDEHGAVLHYQHRDRSVPAGGARSFLIDAGADVAGYAADVTRTHARDGGLFADLVDAMDALQQRLVAGVRPGVAWEDLHRQAHRELADVLHDAGIASADPQTLLERGITRAFLPHGLGHLIGVQTHDAGGRQQDPAGTLRMPPEHHEALRLTRTLAPDWTVTVEPGLYFIPVLLDELRAGPDAQLLDWRTVDALAPCGGIRIEDDVRVTEDGVENLTRDAFEAPVR